MTTQTQPTWRPDLLGEGFEQCDLELPGGALATMVRYTGPRGPANAAETDPTPPPSKASDPSAGEAGVGQGPAATAVLYLHGFVDYFFHPHVAKAIAAHGHAFYAVDLRGYGRSIGRGNDQEIPNYVPDIAIYAEELDAAAAVIRQAGHQNLVLLGHSTGGLIGPLWAQARPSQLRGLILDSPWLDFNAGAFQRRALTEFVHVLAKVAPKAKFKGLHAYYGRALHVDSGGEWDFDLAWKPHDGFPVAAKWFSSIRRAQAQVKRGLTVDCPVLVMTSLRRGDNRHDHPEVLTTDSVLDPRQMWRLAPRLGMNIEVRALEGGSHDLALSPEPIRSRYLTEITDWLDQIVLA
ncbi:MAG: alpha/beta hydrolase [Micrococcales bacterium]|nr:alpha/beta hydrolase [Micrococcales bacterium]